MDEEVFDYKILVREVDPLILRDDLVAEASAHFGRCQRESGIAALQQLEYTTIDGVTIAKTDPFLPLIARGKRIIATCDYQRIPGMTKSSSSMEIIRICLKTLSVTTLLNAI
jgi:hypothetical protein